MPEEFELIDLEFDEYELEVLDDWDFDCDIDDEYKVIKVREVIEECSA